MIRLVAGPCVFVFLAVLAAPARAAESIDADWFQHDQSSALQVHDVDSELDARLDALRLAQQNDASSVTALHDLGAALARSGRHAEAVPYLERGLAIARSRYGVFDLRQLDLLKQLAASLTALGRFSEAQDYMLYAVRAAEKTYGEGNLKVVPAFCDLGDWFADVHRYNESRMAYQAALNIVGITVGDTDIAAVVPLRQLAASFMRELSYREALPNDGAPAAFKGSKNSWKKLVNRTEAALLQAVRILDSQDGASTQMLIETLLQTGDWFQINKAPERALPYYQRAWRLIAAELAPTRAPGRLDFPARVYFPTPAIVKNNPAPGATELHYVQVEFDVGADGSVLNARIVEHDTHDRYARDLLDAMRAARFRPRFSDGTPVATLAVTYRQVLRTSSPLRAEQDNR